MQQKKSDKANLESKRPLFFALSLTVVLAAFVVVLEHNNKPWSLDLLSDDMEEVSEDLSIDIAKQEDDMISAIKQNETPKLSSRVEIAPEADNKEIVEPQESQTGQTSQVVDQTKADEEQEEAQVMAVDKDDNALPLRIVEQLPEFPGGTSEFVKWLTRNLRYPYKAQKEGIEGKVVVSFVVNTDGSLSDMSVTSGVDELLDKEALRVLRLSPKWHAGKEKGKPCRTYFSVPIVFSLMKQDKK